MSQVRSVILAVAIGLFVPALAYAQGTITGTVRDASGAVLPGVTVEVSSAALIEKTRSAVSDGAGVYRIQDLRPGTYVVTFTLQGFTTVKREGIELFGSFTATVNTDMRVGQLSETITVTGAAPLVDVQNTSRQTVMQAEVIDAIPSAKNFAAVATLVVGVTQIVGATGPAGATNQDVGGSLGEGQVQFVAHGSRTNDATIMINGVTYSAGNGSTGDGGQNVALHQELVIDSGSIDAASAIGGVRINYIPKEGGNTFHGSVYVSGANPSWQADNIDQDLISRGLPAVNPIKALWDVAPTFGGPIAKDRLWFFGGWRRTKTASYLAGRYENLNAGNPNSWTYAPDLSKQVFSSTDQYFAGGRVTWQVSSKHKVGIAIDQNHYCRCPNLSGTTSLEASGGNHWDPLNNYLFDYSTPISSRLLFQAGFIYHVVEQSFPVGTGLIGVTETAPVAGSNGSASYRGAAAYTSGPLPSAYFNSTMSYVTGSHAAKFGVVVGQGKNLQTSNQRVPVQYIFTRGVPTLVTANLAPIPIDQRTQPDLGIFAQDKWSMGRLTLNAALRFDYLKTLAGETHLGPTLLQPNRDITFPETDLLSLWDLNPRVGVAYDLFGNGRTALRAAANRYVQQWGNRSINISPAPSTFYVATATRAWTDGNGNFAVDCDLLNVALQDNLSNGGDRCGALTGNALNFGKVAPNANTVDPALLKGRGVRPYSWEFSIGVQDQIVPGVAVDVAYFRRVYGNFYVTDNRSIGPSDYTYYDVTAPVDARLPNGGGYTVAGLADINPASARIAPSNFITMSDNYGKQFEHWNGVDFNVSARLARGLTLAGGAATGRRSSDNCEIVAKLPELLGTASATAGVATSNVSSQCHIDGKFRTQVKGIASYTVPKVDVQLSMTMQSLPGVETVGNYVAASGTPAVGGRVLSNNVPNVTVNLIPPGQHYGDRSNQIDLRFGKVLRVGRSRSVLSVDLYNALNANAVLAENQAYSAFRAPVLVLGGRLVKFTAQFDF